MPWVAITTNDVLAALNHAELAAYQNFRPAPGQADPLATLTGHVTNEIRAVIRRRHQLDAGGGLPESLAGTAAAIIAHRLLLRCNAKPSEGRQTAHDEALAFLERVGAGQVGVEAPVTPVAEATSAPAPRVKRPRLRFTSLTEEGL